MSIYREKVLTASDLFINIFSPEGVLTNVFSITYEIALSSTPLVLIVSPTAATNSITGKYFAGWTVPANELLVSHILTWRWKLTAGSTEQTKTENFTVMEPSSSEIVTPDSPSLYVTVDEIKSDVGNSISVSMTDSDIKSRIVYIMSQIDKITDRFFNLQTKTFYLDGNGTEILKTPVPIIDITKVEIKTDANTFTEKLLTNFDIYNSIVSGNDDRDYPKIQFSNFGNQFSNINTFPNGKKNIRITGTFGYLDESNNTPSDIKKVVKLMFLKQLGHTSDIKGLMEKGRRDVEETEKNRHEIPLNLVAGELTGDWDIDNILRLYTKPTLVYSI